MTFPVISEVSDLLPFIEGNSQIRVKVCEETSHTVVCYMLQDEDTFAGENFAFERECRGITFDESGNLSARTLHKFFNVGEREDNRPDRIDWSRVVRIMEKRDGSMVTPVLVKGEVRFKTKKSFTNDEAALALQVATDMTGGIAWCARMLLNGLTPTFEITSRRFPIVVPYDRDELTLLHIRANTTGRYLTESEIVAAEAPFAIVENQTARFASEHGVSWDLMRAAVEEVEGMEGWVVQFDDGDMLKLKTVWYSKLHRAVTFTRWRDIARAVCAGEGDDLKGMFAMCSKPIAPVLTVEAAVRRAIESAQRHVGRAVSRCVGCDAKTVAFANKEDPLFGLIMAAFRGKEIDYMAWYIKSKLDEDWGLEVAK